METDLSLVNAVKQTGSSKAMTELISRHSGVYLDILESHLPSETFPTQKEDLRREKDFHIYQAVETYRPDSNMKFPVYLGQTIKWKCLALRSKRKDKQTVSFDSLEVKPTIEKEDNFAAKEKMEKIFEFAETYPNELARKIVGMRYYVGKRKSWKKIAKELDISVSWATFIHTQFLKDARKHFSVTNQ